MTKKERDKTLWNVTEVETMFNVPRSAKVLKTAISYAELPEFLGEYLVKPFNKYFVGRHTRASIAKKLREQWNSDREFEYDKNWIHIGGKKIPNYGSPIKGLWMKGERVSSWNTEDKDGVSITHHIFFEKVHSRTT